MSSWRLFCELIRHHTREVKHCGGSVVGDGARLQEHVRVELCAEKPKALESWKGKKNHDAICRKNLGHEFCLADTESGPLSRIWGSWFPCNLLKGFYASANIYRCLVLVAPFSPDTKSVLMQTNWPSRVRVVRLTTSFFAVRYRSFVVWPERTPRRLPPCWYSHTGGKKAISETFADRMAVNSRYKNKSWSLKSVIGNLNS